MDTGHALGDYGPSAQEAGRHGRMLTRRALSVILLPKDHPAHFFGLIVPGDLRIGAELIDFKTKHPLNVSLIAGNREIKCRRFTYELSANIQQRLLNGVPAFWNPKSLPRHYAMQQMLTETKGAASNNALERYVLSKSDEEAKDCRASYTKSNPFKRFCISSTKR